MNPFSLLGRGCVSGNLGYNSIALEEEVDGVKNIHWAKFRAQKASDAKSVIENIPHCASLGAKNTASAQASNRPR